MDKPGQRDWSREAVARTVAADFPPQDQELVVRELDRFKGDSVAGQARVHLAILKLSEGEAKRVHEFTDVALRDWRDVLFWAEYPQEAALNTPEKVAAFRKMCQQFGVKIDVPDPPPPSPRSRVTVRAVVVANT